VQIELDKAERRLQREARGGSFLPTQLPAERLYLQAVHTATADPDTALSTLQSIVDLYANDEDATSSNRDGQKHTEPAGNQPGRIGTIVELAKRRIVTLQKDIAQEREVQLADIRERLGVAVQLIERDPPKAAAMFRAIIDLYEGESWAAEVVAEARGQLERIETNE
jgi:hypothetical protein